MAIDLAETSVINNMSISPFINRLNHFEIKQQFGIYQKPYFYSWDSFQIW